MTYISISSAIKSCNVDLPQTIKGDSNQQIIYKGGQTICPLLKETGNY